MSQSPNKQNPPYSQINSVVAGVHAEYVSYTKDRDTLPLYYKLDKVQNQLVTRNQDLQEMELYYREEKNKIERIVYNFAQLFHEKSQLARNEYTHRLEEQYAMYKSNLQKLQEQLSFMDPKLKVQQELQDFTNIETLRAAIGDDYGRAQQILEQIFAAKRDIELQKRSAWTLHKVAIKLSKVKLQKPSVAEDKVWKESEEKFKNILNGFFNSLTINELKSFESYSKKNAPHFSITQDDFFEVSKDPFQLPATPLIHYFEPGSTNLFIVDLRNLKGDAMGPANLQKIELDYENNVPEWHATMVTPQGKIFLMGGVDFRDHNKSSKRAYVFRGSNKALVRVNDMALEREAFSAVYANGKIYAIGGISAGRGIITECEAYDIEKDQWVLLGGKLNTKCCQAAVCNFKNKYIYKFGGLESKSAQGAKYNENIEKYYIEQDQWKTIAPKLKECILSAAISINQNQIFIFGGVTTSYEKLNDTFILNVDKEPKENGWESTERVIAMNQYVLPAREGFWSNQPIIFEKNVYALQNVKLNEIYYGSAVGHRKLLRFSGKDWKAFN